MRLNGDRYDLDSYESTIYNALPSVEDVDLRLKRSAGRERFFSRASDALRRFDIDESIGVCLLHRHNDVTPSQKMVQTPEITPDGFDCLITSPLEQAYGSVPSSWKVVKDDSGFRLHPLEYAVDPVACRGYDELASKPDFVDAFAKCLIEHNLEDVLGLAIVDRSAPFTIASGRMFLERTSEDPPANIVTTSTVGADMPDLIHTNWAFRPDASETTGCIIACVRGCIPRSPGHDVSHRKACTS